MADARRASRDPADQARVEALVGNPAQKLLLLKERIQDEHIREFSRVEVDFLDLLWSIDTYRREHVIPRTPRAVGAAVDKDETGEGLYRSKGNWFSEIMALILGNKTTSVLASRSKIAGFSQNHQIDIAWPDRDTAVLRDPLICCEAKLTGAPGVKGGKPRGGLADWTNRRKELKFQATDLKLARHSTSIHNWNAWRKKADPRVYTLWAARLESVTGNHDEAKQYARMVKEAQILTATYSDGVGIYAFKPDDLNQRYVPVTVSTDAAARVTTLDEVLDEIAGEIKERMEEHGNRVPPPRPSQPPLAIDISDDDSDQLPSS
ncbi:hypothetical protein C5C86_13575 [Rathayibacter sp. AY1E4]|uniref:hypothetical protein n=1 Tax=unclassified Rathayibacter TaxID=2609250 RepID=UPI000CE8205D|nr:MULTISPECIES: hypothetical protein [unclassified Rathayibacter]PPF09986.1 hypothetical protein C5B98_14015 [Rathayibacter sp. AY1A5]PPF33084.1 hypothetical protein C5B93_14340 [Rathayibacter sp. AY1A2]PPG37118.1 hypothetical protein C5C30_13970 [Rathayibacter sp. AY2B5]PPH08219.1 hypothetical protein C5C71_13145 [Rathayibacter sp. AY1C1]PPH14430.1 hypothetical protein C5C35_14550 [Rathayibacter sp. AY1F8]